MSRQQRRQQSRKASEKKGVPWERIIMIGVLAFFVVALSISYLFPVINARSYAAGSERVQRIIITRALKDLKQRTDFEFVYYGTYEAEADEHDDEPHMHWAEYIVSEKSGVATFSDPTTKEPVAQEDLLTEYHTLQSTISGIESAMQDKGYKVRYAGDSTAEADVSALFLEMKQGEEHKGYILYFTDAHKIDNIEVLEKIGEEEYARHFFFGVTSGVPQDMMTE